MEGSEAMDDKDLVWQSVQSDQTYPADGPFSSPPSEDVLPASCIKQEVISHTDDGCPTSTVVTDGSVGSIQVKEEPPYTSNEDPYATSQWPDLHQQTVDAPFIRNTPYMCFTCGAEFLSLSDVQTHSYTHTYRIGETVFSPITNIKSMSEKAKSTKLQECSLCGIKVIDQDTLDIHIRENHTCKKIHTCSTCGKGFLNVKNLKIHVFRHSQLKYSHACSYCTKVFSTTFELGAHMDIHNGLKPHVCLVCNEGFAYLPELHSHPNNQKDELPYKCEECGESFTSKLKLRGHDYVHTGKLPHPCPCCGKGFWRLNEVIKHKRIYHSNPHKCAICGRGYMTESGMISHIKYTHENPEGLPTDPIPQPQSIKSKPKRESKYYCDVCGQGFMREFVLQRHSTTHIKQEKMHPKGYKCLVCFQTFQSLEEHIAIVPTLRCKLCKKLFCGEESLKLHMKVHTCSTCGKLFRTSAQRQEHEEVHSGKRPYTCFLCGRAYRTLTEIYKHAKPHITKGQYACTVCKVLYADQKELDNHSCTYKVEGYQCFLCGKLVGQIAMMKLHVEKSHTCTKLHRCPHCGSGFERKAVKGKNTVLLRVHLRNHADSDPHTCTFCDKTFCTVAELERHVDTHTGKTPHVCPVCGEGFPSLLDLQNHHYTETDKMPHGCPDCTERFWRASDLTKHTERHERTCPWCKKIFFTKTEEKKDLATGKTFRLCPPCCIEYEEIGNQPKKAETETASPVESDCRLCVEGFEQVRELKDHLSSHA